MEGSSPVDLCSACLVSGRRLRSLSDEQRCHYAQILNEILLEGEPSVARVCWECASVLRRSLSFQRTARLARDLLQAYRCKSGGACPDISRPSRLRVHAVTSVELLPCAGAAETSADKREADTDSVERGEEAEKLEEVQLSPVKCESETEVPWPQRGDRVKLEIKKETERSDPEDDCLFRSDDSDNLGELESEVKAFIRGEKRKKVKKRRGERESKKVQKVIKSLQVKKKKVAAGAGAGERGGRRCAEERVRTVEMSHEEMVAERARDAARAPYAGADYKCTSCLVGFSYHKSYVEHMDTRHDPSRGDYSCPVCKTVMASVDSFTAHYKRHLRRYECAACGKRTMDRKVMTQHYRSAHEGGVREYACHCGHVSRSLDAHRYHKDTHKARVECAECDKTFSHRAGLMNHRLSVHKLNNMFPCTLCDKVFRWKASLKKHVERHERKFRPPADAPYCEPCGVSFSSVCTYQRHMRSSLKHVTESELRFVCAHCGRKFSNKTKLRDHIEEKHLHKQYRCDICQKPSKNRVCLDQHIRNVHKGRPNNKMCHHCGKGFPTKVQLESHIRSHTGERPFICEFCPTTFSQQSNLYKHNRQVHMNIKAKRYPPLCRKRRDKPPAPVPAPPAAVPAPPHPELYPLGCVRYDALAQ